MGSKISFGYVILYVEDVAATVTFYQKAFGLDQRLMHESHQYAEMETGETILAFVEEGFIGDSHVFRLNRRDKDPAGAEIAFVVDDVEVIYKLAIKLGATEVHQPAKKPWGQTVSYVRDNNGFIVEICSAMSQ